VINIYEGISRNDLPKIESFLKKRYGYVKPIMFQQLNKPTEVSAEKILDVPYLGQEEGNYNIVRAVVFVRACLENGSLQYTVKLYPCIKAVGSRIALMLKLSELDEKEIKKIQEAVNKLKKILNKFGRVIDVSTEEDYFINSRFRINDNTTVKDLTSKITSVERDLSLHFFGSPSKTATGRKRL